MKCDIKILRQIMLLLEDKLEITMLQEPRNVGYEELSSEMEGVSTPDVLHHLEILRQRDFINAEPEFGDGKYVEYWVTSITPKGYDFLDAVRDDTVWGKCLKFANEHKGAALSFLIEKFKAL